MMSGQYLGNRMENNSTKALFPIVSVDAELIVKDGNNYRVNI